MSRRRKNGQNEASKEEEINESWLLPYADLLTLLLALFIVLFAMSSVDAEKFQSLSDVFSEIFTGGTGFIDENVVREEGPYEMPFIPSIEQQDNLREIQKKSINILQIRD